MVCLVAAAAAVLGAVVPGAGWGPPRGSLPDSNHRRHSRFLRKVQVRSGMPKEES